MRFPDPAKALETFPFELSGGLRQRAMIAMALICRPALLIADEPTTALDVTVQARILSLMADLQAEFGMAMLIITHDLGVVANVAKEVVVMYHGQVMESGTREHIFRQPEHPYLKALLNAVPRFDMKPGERLVPIRAISPGKASLLERKDRPAADKITPLLSVRGLRKSFTTRKAGWFGAGVADAHVAVDDVSFEIYRGECLGLVGESGCGKTTTGKVIMRAISTDAGEVLFNDGEQTVDLLQQEGDALLHYRRNIQFIFQDPFGSLNPRMTVYDIISEPLVIHKIGDADARAEMVKEPDAAGRPRRALPEALSAQLLGRSAPAHRHRPRARAKTRSADMRRAGLGARCLDPGAGSQSTEGPAGRTRPDLSVRLAQPRRRRLHRGPNRRHVRQPAGRTRATRRVVPQSGAPLHQGAARRRARAQPRPAA